MQPSGASFTFLPLIFILNKYFSEIIIIYILYYSTGRKKLFNLNIEAKPLYENKFRCVRCLRCSNKKTQIPHLQLLLPIPLSKPFINKLLIKMHTLPSYSINIHIFRCIKNIRQIPQINIPAISLYYNKRKI